tara:strand:+ start:437 stop:619 length:183 start_codon:yes stop_codon:yes gene_type:complete
MQITKQQLVAMRTETSNAALTLAQVNVIEDSIVRVANSYYKILNNNYVLQLDNDFETWGN